MRNQWKYYLENAEEINKQFTEAVQGRIITKDLYTCVCGSKIRFTALKKHLCSIKHINFATCNQQNKTVEDTTNK